MISSVDDGSYSFSCLQATEGVVGEASIVMLSLVDDAQYSFLLSVVHGGGGSSNDLPAFYDGGGSDGVGIAFGSFNNLPAFYDGGESGGLGVTFGRVNYFHLPVTSLATVPYHVRPPMHGFVSSRIQKGGGAPFDIF